MQFSRRWTTFAIVPMIALALPGSAYLLTDRNDTTVATDKVNLRLVADLSDKRLKMYEADTLLWQYPISDGMDGYATPPGNYSVRHLIWNPRWTPPPNSKWARKYTPKPPGHPANPMRVVKIFFREPDYYIHGTYETAKLGNAASHGCLRMDPDHVAEVARYMMEHGGQPREESWFRRVLRFNREERHIYLKQPIPLTITR